jgi:hypothetical protein
MSLDTDFVGVLQWSMCPETNEPDTASSAAVVQKPAPGLMAGICSIVAGVIGFSIPIAGIVVSCAGIWLGVKGIRQGRAENYRPSIICGISGLCIAGLGIVFWVCAILFESYR